MRYSGSDFSQGSQHESPLMHRPVGHLKISLVDDERIEKKNIDVHGSRAFIDLALPAQVHLDLLNACEQLFGSKFGFDLHRTIQKPRLFTQFHGLSFVQGGNPTNVAEPAKSSYACAQVSFAFAKVGSEREIGEVKHQARV